MTARRFAIRNGRRDTRPARNTTRREAATARQIVTSSQLNYARRVQVMLKFLF
jgi:hypothetical protein